ncbi:hypothetical protein Bca52824_009628 [Brassica carinata]|uniref:Uncharacterized protein n=1 Tax=Brassica carinata TaxID=52824 RepID=A0A8X7WD04_BRACI|nr:hypothetical protein Bca52824_009628 [Brassica carinata]
MNRIEYKKKYFLFLRDRRRRILKRITRNAGGRDMTPSPTSEAVEDEQLISSSTMEKVAATKNYIKNHYNKRLV